MGRVRGARTRPTTEDRDRRAEADEYEDDADEGEDEVAVEADEYEIPTRRTTPTRRRG